MHMKWNVVIAQETNTEAWSFFWHTLCEILCFDSIKLGLQIYIKYTTDLIAACNSKTYAKCQVRLWVGQM
jgi:hypothetical protein